MSINFKDKNKVYEGKIRKLTNIFSLDYTWYLYSLFGAFGTC